MGSEEDQQFMFLKISYFNVFLIMSCLAINNNPPAVAVRGVLLTRRRTLPPLVGLRQAVAAPA